MLRLACRACRAQQVSTAARAQLRYVHANTKDTSEYHNPTPVASPSPPGKASAAPAGTVLKGLGYLQNKPAPIALPDNEYPSWLWNLLDENKTSKSGPMVEVSLKGERVRLDKKEVRRKNRESIRSANFLRGQ